MISPTFIPVMVKCEMGTGVGRQSPKRRMLLACPAQWLRVWACESAYWLCIVSQAAQFLPSRVEVVIAQAS